MAPPSRSITALAKWLGRILKAILGQDIAEVLQKILELETALTRLRDRIRYHGTYEILDYDSTLEFAGASPGKNLRTGSSTVSSPSATARPMPAGKGHAAGRGAPRVEIACRVP